MPEKQSLAGAGGRALILGGESKSEGQGLRG